MDHRYPRHEQVHRRPEHVNKHRGFTHAAESSLVEQGGDQLTTTWTSERGMIEVSGPDRFEFLQGLTTNDVKKTSHGLVYSAILTPQGKFLFDFFMLSLGGAIVIDIAGNRAEDLMKRLNMYKLRSRVKISEINLPVARGLGVRPPGSMMDPRHEAMGWRVYGNFGYLNDVVDWTRIRVEHCIPETMIELIDGQTYILEAGFERLNGIDFHKGCYVGQEVTARMKHKTSLRKGLKTVEVSGTAPIGTEIKVASRTVGTLLSQSHGKAIAMLRFDRIGNEPLTAGSVQVRLREQGTLSALS